MTNVNDPYQYGPPIPVQPSKPTGKQILTSSWAMLREDRQLLALPFLSALAALLAAGVLFVPGWALGAAITGNAGKGAAVGGVVAAFAASMVSIYFQAALVVGANIRADGGTPTLSGVLRATSKMMGPILSWAALTTTVGVAIRAAEERLGIFGKIIGFLGGLAWAIATYLAVPVVVAEGLGPIAAAKRSAELIRTVWGIGIRTTLRLGMIQLLLVLPSLAALVVGFVAVVSGSTVGIAVGIVLIVAAVLSLFALGAVFSAIYSYARAMIYRYATGRPVPGISAEVLAGAFMPKKKSRFV